MNYIYKIFSSIKLSLILLTIYFVSIGLATFVENDFGTPAAKWLIYKASWFDLLHLLLVINLIIVIYKYKMFKLKKLTILIFHVGFIVTIIGAGITRFISYEGIMHIRLGKTENIILTYPTYLNFKINDNEYQYESSIPVNFNNIADNEFNKTIDFRGKKFDISLEKYVPNAGESIVESENGKTIILFTIADEDGHNDFFIKEGESKYIKEQKFSFDDGNDKSSIYIHKTDTGLIIVNPYPMNFVNMSDTLSGYANSEEPISFVQRRLYKWYNKKLVIKQIYENSETIITQQTKADMYPLAALILKIKDDKTEKTISVFGKETYKGTSKLFSLDNYNFDISYGSKEIKLPFSLTLDKFVLDRYPGSMSPSSYESYITLNDTANNFKKDYKIYMNNVLAYKGFRFYQSSFDPDEQGTVLSVNHDSYGTIITYLGYLMLAIGMFLTIFNKNSRFKQLNKKVKEISKQKAALTLLFIGFLGFSNSTFAQDLPVVNAEHAKKFGELLVQDKSGRIKPVNTTNTELLLKLSKRSTYKDLDADQVMLSIIIRPDLWANEPLIAVRNPDVIKEFNIKDKHLALTDVFTQDRKYLLKNYVDVAYSKTPAHQTKFDKEIIKIDERVNVLYGMLSLDYLNIFPKLDDPNNKWYNINTAKQAFKGVDSTFIQNVFHLYVSDLRQSLATNNWAKADSSLNFIKTYQEKAGSNIVINRTKINAEIFYNKVAIFRHLFEFYFIAGLVFLVILFVDILWKRFNVRIISAVFFWTILLAFVFHTFGLALRWYIAEHAPWSNGYESMIYISWSTMLAGLLFYKNSKISLAATTVLSGMILLVAHLSWIDPQITNLVPVLKSYWLTIHVAVITASYGFLGLGAIIGFINLIFMVLINEKNKTRLSLNIKQLTYINEMTLIAGLFLLTVGTFLGGVWANESWGRYWGWDSKETWALATMVVYAIVVHFRFIPSLKGIFAFNFASLLSFSTVLMTYFGVNYYLSGLHSYAKGDPVPIPIYVYYVLGVIFVISIFAFIKQKKMKI